MFTRRSQQLHRLQDVADDGTDGGSTGGSGSDEPSFDMAGALDEMSTDLFGGDTPTDHGEPDDAPEVETKPETPATPVTPETPTTPTTRTAPQSWKKEMHEKFATLPPDVQEYIEQREVQMRDGLEKDRGDAVGRAVENLIFPERVGAGNDAAHGAGAIVGHQCLQTVDLVAGGAVRVQVGREVVVEGAQRVLDPGFRQVHDTAIATVDTQITTGRHDVNRDLTPLILGGTDHIGLGDVQQIPVAVTLVCGVRGVIQWASNRQAAIFFAVVTALIDATQQSVAVGHVVLNFLAVLAESGRNQFRKSAVWASHDGLLSINGYEI